MKWAFHQDVGSEFMEKSSRLSERTLTTKYYQEISSLHARLILILR